LLLFVRHRKLINAATQNGKLYELSWDYRAVIGLSIYTYPICYSDAPISSTGSIMWSRFVSLNEIDIYAIQQLI
jgi:hypothetical protein